MNTISRHCSQTTVVNVKDFIFLSTLFSAAGTWQTGRNLTEWYSTENRPATSKDQARLGSSRTLNVSISYGRPE